MKPISYARHRFPPDLIRHAVWLYMRFTLSYRDVEDLLAERGLDISYETVRGWVLKFGPAIARNLRCARGRPDDRWHLDERWPGQRQAHVPVARRRQRRGGAGHAGPVEAEQGCSPEATAQAVKKQGFAPRAIVTDKLRSYAAALRELGFSGQHDQSLRDAR